MTHINRANLEILAKGLRSLPPDWEHFHMSLYRARGGRDLSPRSNLNVCGTVACAVGTAPMFGIEPLPDEDWVEYSERTLISDSFSHEWNWCFSPVWADTAPHHYDAASRIEILLDKGLPSDAWAQRWGNAPLCFERYVMEDAA